MGSFIKTDKEKEIYEDNLKDTVRIYEFKVWNGHKEVVFHAVKPSLEDLEEEIGRYERHFKK